jgi:hypothetical protein
MGLKLSYASWKRNKRICVGYDGLQYKRVARTFKITEKKKALDFAMTLDNLYIDSCDEDILLFAESIHHPILTKKNWCFA